MEATAPVIDVREIPKPQRHPLIFVGFADLHVGANLQVVANHEPKHLRDEFERDYPGCFTWRAEEMGDRHWVVTITKTAKTAPPRLLTDTTHLVNDVEHADASGALWRLEERDRQLDSNVIAIPPNGVIDEHIGPDLDVLILVLRGDGRLVGETTTIDLREGALIWLPRLSQREFQAGEAGLRYLTVHTKRPMLTIASSAAGTHASS